MTNDVDVLGLDAHMYRQVYIYVAVAGAVANALVRAVSPLMATQMGGATTTGVHTSVNAARTSACATSHSAQTRCILKKYDLCF